MKAAREGNDDEKNESDLRQELALPVGLVERAKSITFAYQTGQR
jgi:hypothetical protein